MDGEKTDGASIVNYAILGHDYDPTCRCGHGSSEHENPMQWLKCLVAGCDCQYFKPAVPPAALFEAGPFVEDDQPAPRVCAEHHSADVQGEWVCWQPEGHAGGHAKSFRVVFGPPSPSLTLESNPTPFAARDEHGIWHNRWNEAIPPAGFGHLALLLAGFCPFCFASAETETPFDSSGERDKLPPAGHYRGCPYPAVRHGWVHPQNMHFHLWDTITGSCVEAGGCGAYRCTFSSNGVRCENARVDRSCVCVKHRDSQ